MAAAIASRGFNVVGVDVDRRAVDLVNAGQAPVQETSLDEMTAANRERIRATLSHHEAILNSDVSFVIVPTPSDERGAFSLQYATWAFGEIGRALVEKRTYHLVVLTSTVLPGSTRYGLLPILEQQSGRKCGPDFGLCYSPEFIALGSVIHDFLNPDFTLVGEFDEQSGRLLESCYADITQNNPSCMRMSIENAELTKIAVNTFVTTKIAFANMLADLCERIPGGNTDVVTGALGRDRRIGPHYLKGGLGYGGPCFPRDNVALGFIARQLGMQATLAETTDQMNRARPRILLDRIRPLLRKGVTVAVLGLAYKPSSHVIEESQGIALAWEAFRAGARVVAFDPLAAELARSEFRGQILVLEDLSGCLAQAEVVLVTTPDPVFQALRASDFLKGKSAVTVVDFWRILDKQLAGRPGIHYIPAGRSTNDKANELALAELWNNAAVRSPE
jgi:UDPglucose 6-dehydrogenase